MSGWLAAAQIGGELLSAGLNYKAQTKANKTNVKLQREQQDWEERMSSTAYQRAVQDMQAAGLNPMLAVQQGGASTPNVSAATVQPVDALARGVSSAAGKAMQVIAVKQGLANVELTLANAKDAAARADTNRVTAQNAEFRQQLEMEQINRAIDKSIQDSHLTQEEVTKIRELMPLIIRQARADAATAEYGVSSAKAESQLYETLGGFGKAGGLAGTATTIIKNLITLLRRKK